MHDSRFAVCYLYEMNSVNEHIRQVRIRRFVFMPILQQSSFLTKSKNTNFQHGSIRIDSCHVSCIHYLFKFVKTVNTTYFIYFIYIRVYTIFKRALPNYHDKSKNDLWTNCKSQITNYELQIVWKIYISEWRIFANLVRIAILTTNYKL